MLVRPLVPPSLPILLPDSMIWWCIVFFSSQRDTDPCYVFLSVRRRRRARQQISFIVLSSPSWLTSFHIIRVKTIYSIDDDDYMKFDSKNQGLINSIVNDNNRLKHIEQKFNFITNNFVNLNLVNELTEKTNDIEKRIFGALCPHSSWRDLLLSINIVGTAIFLSIKVGRKCFLPWMIKKINDQHSDEGGGVKKQLKTSTISDDSTLNNHWEQNEWMRHCLVEQMKRIDHLINTLQSDSTTKSNLRSEEEWARGTLDGRDGRIWWGWNNGSSVW